MTQVLTCRIGHEWYAIPLDAVLETLLMLALHDVPDADILGMMTLREQVIPVIDLRERLGVADPTFTLDTPLIAVIYEGQQFALAVDEIDGVITPALDDGIYTSPYIQRVYTNDNRVLFELNLSRLAPMRRTSDSLPAVETEF